MIIGDQRTVLPNRLLDIRCIAPMFFAGFCTESSIRIRRILEDSGAHALIIFCAESVLSVFNDGLLRKTADKQLVFRGIFKSVSAPFQQKIRV